MENEIEVQAVINRIYELQQRLGWTDKQLAESMGYSNQSSISNWKTTPKAAKYDTLICLKKVAPEVSIDWIISGTGSMFLQNNEANVSQNEKEISIYEKHSDEWEKKYLKLEGKFEQLQEDAEKLRLKDDEQIRWHRSLVEKDLIDKKTLIEALKQHDTPQETPHEGQHGKATAPATEVLAKPHKPVR